MPWSPIGPEIRILSPGRTEAGSTLTPRNQASDSGGRDIHLVRLAVLDNFRVAARDPHARGLGGLGDRANFCFENRRGKSGFEHT